MREVFNPEAEVQKILVGDSESRKEKLEKFKIELSRRKSGLGSLYATLANQIGSRTDFSEEELLETASQFATELKLTPRQKRLIEGFLDDYFEKHLAVRAVCEQYPDGQKLYARLFGRRPRGKVELVERPAVVWLRAHNAEDFFRAFHWNDKAIPHEDPPLNKQDVQTIQGFLFREYVPPSFENLKWAIGVENAAGRPMDDPFSQEILSHEEQHSANALFKGFLTNTADSAWSPALSREFKACASDRERKNLLKRYFRLFLEVEFTDWTAQEEILAHFKDGTPKRRSINLLVQSPKNEEDMYDFYSVDQAQIEMVCERKLGKEFGPLIREASQEIFDQEFNALVRKGIKALHSLASKGYSKDEAIGMLVHLPLRDWPKTVANRIRPKGDISSHS